MKVCEPEEVPAPRRSDRTRAAILDAARRRFAAHGFERTTIRAVAADAGIDPSMVMRYFGSKARLFDAALDIDLNLPDLSATPADELAETVVRHFLRRWEHDGADDALLLLLRSAVTNGRAAQRMREIFAGQVAPSLGEAHAEKAGLISTQLLGLALTRQMLRIPGVARMTSEEVVAAYAPAIRSMLQSPPAAA
ncbi:TetR family transcriptional regulator [Streptomyces sp. NPDC026665]|uniref:TetR/AcrR family transcriptional regulator n=1 Tax=Streptomyces sp. NPDC026665 TaxID=3154798 RepID=UPI0033D609A7